MKIALINENSQAAKNEIIYNSLKNTVEPMGHEVLNFGMYSADDETQLTYVMNGLLAAILLNSKSCRFCRYRLRHEARGAMLALNSFPGVLCGHVTSPLDAYLFGQVNDGNAIAMPFAQGFGWGAELNLDYTFGKSFSQQRWAAVILKRGLCLSRETKRFLTRLKRLHITILCMFLRTLTRTF